MDGRQDRQEGVIVKLDADPDKRLDKMNARMEAGRKELRRVVGIGAGFIILIVALLKFIG